MMAVRRELKFNKVLEALAYDILTGVLKPRERLVETDCMQRYKANRNTIRKIFKELQLKKLVKHYPNRGATIAELSEKELKDIYDIRILLENHAADLVIKNSDEEALHQIRTIKNEFEQFVHERNFRGMLLTNITFHQKIFQLCGNKALSELIDQLRTRAHLIRHYIWRQPGRLEKSVEEHDALIQAIENRDAEELKRINERHITAGLKNYIEDLRGFENEFTINNLESTERWG